MLRSDLIAEQGVFRSREKYGGWRIHADLIAGEGIENSLSDLIAGEDAVRRSTRPGKMQVYLVGS
jgi:hypothetical protein